MSQSALLPVTPAASGTALWGHHMDMGQSSRAKRPRGSKILVILHQFFRTLILNHSLIGLGSNQGCHNLCSLCLRFGDQWNSVDDSHMCLRACNKMVHGSAPRSPSLDTPSLIAAAASAMAASWLLLAGGNTSAIDFTAPRKSDSVVLTLLSRRHQ